jgi:hypothetical protein
MLIVSWLSGMVLLIVPPICIVLHLRLPDHRRRGWPAAAAPTLVVAFGLNLTGWLPAPKVACSFGLPPVCLEISAPAEAPGGGHP